MTSLKLPEGPIHIAGHRGMVGAAVVRALKSVGHDQILIAPRSEVDLLDMEQVRAFYAKHKPAAVVVAAAKVGGIHANNTLRADFIYENLALAVNIIEAAFRAGVGRLLFLGSSCIYPKLAPQPLKEDYLLSGPLEPTNEPYAIAKIAGLKLCESYRRQHSVVYHSLMPTNLYGPGDNYHPEHSHVLPALIRRFHEARESGAESVTIWGTGEPRREFLHVDDLAAAVVHMLSIGDPPDLINAGTGIDDRIIDIAGIVAEAVGFQGEILLDKTKPDGTPRKLLDVSRINALGWQAKIALRQGISSTYQAFLSESGNGELRSV